MRSIFSGDRIFDGDQPAFSIRVQMRAGGDGPMMDAGLRREIERNSMLNIRNTGFIWFLWFFKISIFLINIQFLAKYPDFWKIEQPVFQKAYATTRSLL